MKKLYLYSVKTVAFLALISIIILMFSWLGYNNGNSSGWFVEASTSKSPDFPVIILDAGHGGEDGGAEANGVLEKNINLSITKYVSAYLDMSGFKNVMTREDDRLLYNPGEEKHKKRSDLTNRIHFAENYPEGVFVSIHQNKFEIPKYKGLQVYYSKNNKESEALAKIIQNNARQNIDTSNKREVKPADFRIRILDSLKMPAVLVECGFLSNPEEASLLNTEEYQKIIAFVIYKSIVEYLCDNGEKT